MNFHREQQANSLSWNQRTKAHLVNWYRLDAFRQGQTTLDEIQLADVGDVGGKKLLHLQCNAGIDTLSWARQGAIVTGVDFSVEAIKLAEQAKDEVGIPARFICCNLYDLKEYLSESFDIVYTSQGVLCWLKDLKEWGQIISHFLRPGGFFYIMEEHPYAVTLDERAHTLQIANPYFHSSDPVWYPDAHTQGTYEWVWSLADIVNSLIQAGLVVDFLHEYDKLFWQRFRYMECIEQRWWHIPGHRIPLMFTLRARKSEQIEKPSFA
jgi:SAM-dependent methyltransferase